MSFDSATLPSRYALGSVASLRMTLGSPGSAFPLGMAAALRFAVEFRFLVVVKHARCGALVDKVLDIQPLRRARATACQTVWVLV